MKNVTIELSWYHQRQCKQTFCIGETDTDTTHMRWGTCYFNLCVTCLSITFVPFQLTYQIHVCNCVPQQVLKSLRESLSCRLCITIMINRNNVSVIRYLSIEWPTSGENVINRWVNTQCVLDFVNKTTQETDNNGDNLRSCSMAPSVDPNSWLSI